MWIALILRWKVVDAWSKMLKHSSEHRVRHCGELYKCLKMLEVLLAKPLGIYPHICVSTWSVIGPLTFSDIWHTRAIVWSYFCVVATATYLCFSIFFPSIDVFPIPNPQCGKLVVAFFDVKEEIKLMDIVWKLADIFPDSFLVCLKRNKKERHCLSLFQTFF